MIEFKGSQKAFFKAFPKERRSFDEVYCLISYNVITKQEAKTYYQFVGNLSEKSFKKINALETKDVSAEQTKSDSSDLSDMIATLSKKIEDIVIENQQMSEEMAKLKAELKDKSPKDYTSRIDSIESSLNKKIDKNYERLSAETWVLKSCINNHFDAIHSIRKDLRVAKLEVYDNDERWFYMER